MNTLSRILLASAALSVPILASAQGTPPLEITRLTGRVTIDGVPDEPAWRDIPVLPLTMYGPVFRGTPTQRTEIRVAYDDEGFYAAGWFHDTDASGIRINSLYRDRWNGDDAFAIYIDAYNDNQTSKWFGLTAGGTRFDVLLSDDGNASNGSWDTFWAARTTVTDSGWYAEVRIPFSSLGFRTGPDGRAIMGLTVTRLVSRLDERVTFPEIDPKFEFRRPSLARDVVLNGVRSHTPLYVTPYVLSGRARQTIAQTGAPTGFANLNSTSSEAGLDVRYPLSSRMNLDVTINTDFAQVEADDQQVNLDRFPLFYPDRRRFFQEGSEVFDFSLGGDSRLFHSRRIGLAPGTSANLETVPVLGGLRLVGKAAGSDIGILQMQTRARGALPTENFGVLRVRRPVLNPYSSAGFMLTSLASGGSHNGALGADGVFRVGGDHYLTTRVSSTLDSEEPDDATMVSRSHVYGALQRRTQRGLSYTATVTRSGSDFDPGLGFLSRRDYTSANVFGNHYIFTDKHRILRRVYPGFLAFNYWRNTDHALESGTYAVWVQWDTKRGGGGWIEPKWFHEDVRTGFTIGNRVTIPPGIYRFADLQLALSMATGSRLRTSLDMRSGTYFDGRRTQVIINPTWNASKHLELGADYQLSALRFPVRGEQVNIHVARLRVRSALNTQASTNAIVQYNSTTGRMDANLRFRYSLAEGTDLWIVYNEGLDADRSTDPLGVRSPLSLARTLIVKYSHTVAF
jgi:hypothetical protein